MKSKLNSHQIHPAVKYSTAFFDRRQTRLHLFRLQQWLCDYGQHNLWNKTVRSCKKPKPCCQSGKFTKLLYASLFPEINAPYEVT